MVAGSVFTAPRNRDSASPGSPNARRWYPISAFAHRHGGTRSVASRKHALHDFERHGQGRGALRACRAQGLLQGKRQDEPGLSGAFDRHGTLGVLTFFHEIGSAAAAPQSAKQLQPG